MAADSVSLVGGPAPYREALTARLAASGIGIGEGADVVVICCTNESLWSQAADSVLWTPTVIVIADLGLDLFVRALALGAGVVHLDTKTEIMLDVIRAAAAGEALLPLAVTQALATYEPPGSKDIIGTEFEGVEKRIVEALVAGQSIAEIADVLSYSDRTVRRKLQGIYLKLGVTNQREAVLMLRSRPSPD